MGLRSSRAHLSCKCHFEVYAIGLRTQTSASQTTFATSSNKCRKDLHAVNQGCTSTTSFGCTTLRLLCDSLLVQQVLSVTTCRSWSDSPPSPRPLKRELAHSGRTHVASKQLKGTVQQKRPAQEPGHPGNKSRDHVPRPSPTLEGLVAGC